MRLAAAGHSVLVLEAGELAAGPVYDVPVFHAFATESPDMAWNFFVSHYDNEAQAKRDQNTTPAAAACSTRALRRSAAAQRTTR